MTSDSAGMLMFKDTASSLAAVDLERELERAVRVGVNLTRRSTTGIKLAPHTLEKKTLPIIQKMLVDINPTVLGNISKIDARVIWEVYWYMQSKPRGVRVPFFMLLIELNKNPSFVSARWT